MASKSYNELLSKYNIALQRCRDLNNNLNTRNKELSSVTKNSKHTEKLIRELCEKILAKDRSEMRLGKEYSWSKESVDELIEKAKKFYDSYTGETVNKIEKITKKVDELESTIKSREDQIEELLMGNNSSKFKSKKELEEFLEHEKEIERRIENSNAKTRKILENDNIEIIDNDTDLSENENDALEDIAKINNKVTPKSKGSTSTNREKVIKNTVSKTHIIDFGNIIDEMNEYQKEIISVIGSKGKSKFKDIETEVLKNLQITKTTLRSNVKSLADAQVLVQEQPTTPKTKISVYYLSDMGKRIFSTVFPDKTLIQSEAEEIIAEHDNLIHGYGIIYTADELRKKAHVKNVIDKNRNNPIKVSGGSYIPDIVCILDQDVKMYFEYEMGTHSISDFNAKLTKMMRVTKVLNIIFPKKDVMEDVQKKVEKWIDRMGKDVLAGITVRLATYNTIKDMESIRKNSEWDIIYKPDKSGSNPVVKH